MRIAVLGPLEITTDDGVSVPVPGGKERLLLAALTAGAPAAVSVDRLAESIWNGQPPASARKRLQVHVVRLRSALEPDRTHGSTGRYVVRRGVGYALAVDRADVDVLAFGDLVARGRAHLASADASTAVDLLSSAVDLWRGEPYGDWPDAPFAEPERRRLNEVRTAAVQGLLEARLALGEHVQVVPELERLTREEPLHEEWWRLLALALYRCGRQGDALAAVGRARAVLAEELGADPGPQLQEIEAAVLRHDPVLEPPTLRAPVPPAADVARCPYKGLATYQPGDAWLFRGRDRLVDQLVGRLVDATLVVVSGPSGAGKSSVVRAGLVPALARGVLPGSEAWRAVVLAPGRRPADALAGLTGESPPDEPVVLICDQLEELWAPGVDPAERNAFLDAVLGLLDDGILVRCVAVVRGDHVGRLAEHAAFTDRLGGRIVLAPSLTDPELRQIVREPALAVGLEVEAELLDAVAADVLGRPGALPLLSTALVGTWERRRGNLLTLAGYLEVGGVAGALKQSAEAAFAVLDAAGQEAAHRLLVRLADVDDGGGLVRRPLPLAALDAEGKRGEIRRGVVQVFVDRRLLAVDSHRLEVAHEALLTAWPRLARWLEEDAAGRAVRRHLAPAAEDWCRGGRPADELYRGARLVAALDWAEGEDADPTQAEREFLGAARAAADAELREARSRADREAAARRRTRGLAAGLAAVVVVAVVAALLAVNAQGDAQHASTVAEANRLAALSATVESLDVSLLLAAQAVQLADTRDTEDALLAVLTKHPRALRSVPFGGAAQGAELGGGTLFMGVGDHVEAWEVGRESLPRRIFDIPDEWGGWVASDASSLGELAAAGTKDGIPWLRVLDRQGHESLVTDGDAIGGDPLAVQYADDPARISMLVVRPDDEAPATESSWGVRAVEHRRDFGGVVSPTGVGGRFPAAAGALQADMADGLPFAVLWSRDPAGPAALIGLVDGRQVALRPPARAASSLGFRALGDGAAQLWSDGAVTLYDRTGRVVQELDAHRTPVRDVMIAGIDNWAVTAGDDGAVFRWDIDPATRRWTQGDRLVGHTGDVVAVELDGPYEHVITVSLDDTVITWDMGGNGGFGFSYPALDGRWIANRPRLVNGGRVLVAPTRPGTPISGTDRLADPGPETLGVEATFIDVASGRVAASVPVGDTIEGTRFGASVAVSPDGSKVAVTWGLGTTILDAATREEIARVVLTQDGDPGSGSGPSPAQVVSSAGWSADGSRLLLGAAGRVAEGGGGELVVVDAESWRPERRIDIGGSVQVMEPSTDGRLLAVAVTGADEIRLLDAATLDVQRTVPLAVDDRIQDLAFSRDGRYLAGAGQNGLLHVFDTESWQPVGEPVVVNDDYVLQLEWLPDGVTVVAAGRDGTVSLFDVGRGLARARPLPASHDPGEGYVHLAPEPTREIVVLSGHRTGWRYPLDPRFWLAEACGMVGRDFTRAEWNRYLPGRPWQGTCTRLI